LLETLFAAYGLGVALAARMGSVFQNYGQISKAILINPALWSFAFGLLFGISGKTAQAIVLQMAMPPAFATLVLAETFNLDRELAVTALAAGSVVLLVTLPVWLWLF
jgi:malate permease and related proteins